MTLSGGTLSAGAIIETLSGGTAIVSGTVSNGSTFYAASSGALREITSGAVVKGGTVEIGNGIVAVRSGGSATVTFLAGGSGCLQLDGSGIADVRVSGFGITSGATVSFTYTSANASDTSGTLTVISGGVSASVEFIGHYISGDFHLESGASGSVEVIDPPVVNGGSVKSANIALFGNYSAAFAADGGADLAVTSTGQIEPGPLLVHPHR